MGPQGANPEYVIQTLEPLYGTPAKIRGSAQITPRAKFLSDSIAILNFRLDAFHLDTGDLGKILEPFANAFFPGDGDSSPIYQEIVYTRTCQKKCRMTNFPTVHGSRPHLGKPNSELFLVEACKQNWYMCSRQLNGGYKKVRMLYDHL